MLVSDSDKHLMQSIQRYIEANELLRQAGLDPADQVQPLGMGHNNLNYLVESSTGKFVFRLRVDDADPARSIKARAEFDSLQLLDQFGIAPKAVAIDTSCHLFPTTLLVISYVEGDVLAGVDYDYDDAFIAKLVDVTRSIHTLPISSHLHQRDYLSTLEKAIGYLREHLHSVEMLQLINRTFSDLMASIPRSGPERLVPTHGNIWQSNVVASETQFRLIDFESLAMRDPAVELAHIWTDFNDGDGFTARETQTFFGLYGEGFAQPELLARAEAFRPMVAFSAVVRRVQHVLRLRRREMSHLFLERTDIEGEAQAVKQYVSRAVRLNAMNAKYESMDFEELLLA